MLLAGQLFRVNGGRHLHREVRWLLLRLLRLLRLHGGRHLRGEVRRRRGRLLPRVLLQLLQMRLPCQLLLRRLLLRRLLLRRLLRRVLLC